MAHVFPIIEALVLAGPEVDSLPEGELKSACAAILRRYGREDVSHTDTPQSRLPSATSWYGVSGVVTLARLSQVYAKPSAPQDKTKHSN